MIPRTPAAGLVLAAVVLGTALRLTLAATTFGTNDVHYWTEFLEAVREHGPVGIYGVGGFEALYNHPPLAGWWLVAVGAGADAGIPVPFLLRLPASLADAASCGLVYLLVSRRYGGRHGAAAAVALALSPVLVVISGFHGNTDPVFVALLLGALATVERGRPATAGVLLGLACSVKIVPVLAVPLMFWLAARSGAPRARLRFVAGGAVVGLVVWGPALVLRPREVWEQVVAYRGLAFTEWGVPQLLRWLSADATADAYVAHAGVAVAAGAALLGLAAAAYGRMEGGRALGLTMAVFLVATPAFALQYLAWPLATAYLLRPRLAHAYHAAAGALVLTTYSFWNRAWPFGPGWAWEEAVATPFPMVALPMMVLTWLCLVALAVDGITPRRRPLGSLPR